MDKSRRYAFKVKTFAVYERFSVIAQPAFIDDATVSRLLSPADLLAAMPRAFVDPLLVPARSVIEDRAGEGDHRRTMLTMPAVRGGGIALVKVVTAISGAGAGLNSHLFAFDAVGELLAAIDAHQLTARRTAAASVFAARTLGAGRARHFALIGAGRQARAHLEAFAAAMPLDIVTIWARRAEAAEALAVEARRLAGSVRVADSVGDAVRGADAISCVTPSTEPLLHGGMIARGAHVDLVGGFRPDMREADDALIARAAVVIDTPAALAEAGDLSQPIAAGAIRAEDVVLLGDLLSGSAKLPDHEITMFKSVGHASEDLVATELLLERLGLLAGGDPSTSGQVP